MKSKAMTSRGTCSRTDGADEDNYKRALYKQRKFVDIADRIEICPECNGYGIVDGYLCKNCDGIGEVL